MVNPRLCLGLAAARLREQTVQTGRLIYADEAHRGLMGQPKRTYLRCIFQVLWYLKTCRSEER